MTELPANDSASTLWATSNRHDIKFFSMVIEKSIFFAQGFPISSEGVQLGIDKADAGLCLQRQNLLREQGSLIIVLRMINLLKPITEKMDAAKNIPVKRRPVLTDAQHSVNDMGQLLLSQCFKLLYYSILNNPDNQMYVADFLPSLLAHLSAQPLAGTCVTEMLSKNMELQETKITSREIQIFVDKLRSSKMNAMYLQLLQACCSCQGEGVDGNQCKVALTLFSDTNDIIIHLHSEYARAEKAEWDKNCFYAPVTPQPGSPIRGDSLMTKGLPKLSLAWTTNSIDFSPLGLFGKLSVNVEELFRPQTDRERDASSAAPTNKAKSKKKSSEEQKLAVANYFIAEMFLGAEMCMDRNYIAIHKLDPLFQYEVLITIIKMNVSTALKAAAVRLLMCLHVDRDPQATSKIPRLTRTWSSVETHEQPQLPFVDAGRRNVFGLIQQLVSQHVKGMAGRSWDDLSRHMLKMLRMLVEFNFYGNEQRMNDVIVPLVRALNRGKRGAPAVSTTNEAAAPGSPGRSDAVIFAPEVLNTEQAAEPKADGVASFCGGVWERGVSCFAAVAGSGAINIQTAVNMKGATAKLEFEPYRPPARYNKAPIYELETMVEAVDILAFAQRVIDDRNLSLLLRHFQQWQAKGCAEPAVNVFKRVVDESEKLTLGITLPDSGSEPFRFDHVMVDVLMYVHTPLVQSTLEVLMAHHSKKRTLLDNAKGLQLLVSHQKERQHKIVDQMLQQLEQNAETHELWGELSTDADYAVNKQTKDILKELIDICRIRRYVLEFDEEFMADGEIQDLYRNLGCFDICMKVLGLLDYSDEDEEEGGEGEGGDGRDDRHVDSKKEDEVAANTHDLCVLCNNLLYWFFLGNEKNQALGYDELDFFLDSLDAGINSHLVMKAIFKMNEALMRQVPHEHLQRLVDRIMKKGKSHHYLVLFAEISHAGERNIIEHQFEIVKLLTSPGKLEKVGCFFCAVDDPRYAEKRSLMAPYLNSRDLSLEDMPPLLAYHLTFLEVLSGCTVGKDITTVEAKVQSIFSYADQIQSILDPGTIVSTKTRLSRFFFNSVIEVDLKIPGLEQSPLIWTLFESYKAVFSEAKRLIQAVETHGWQSPLVSRQKIEYIVICIQIVGGFFKSYYQSSAFSRSEDRSASSPVTPKHSGGARPTDQQTNHFPLTPVDELVLCFFTVIKEIYDLDSRRFSTETKTEMYEALYHLNRSLHGGQVIENTIRPPPTVRNPYEDGRKKDEDDSEGEVVEDHEKVVHDQLEAFLADLDADADLQKDADNENVAFIRILEALKYVKADCDDDVRQESLIKKLVFHIRENIKIVNGQKRLDARVTKTSTWIIRAFRTMIENKMGMSIYQRDDEGGAEEDEKAAPVVDALNSCGATALCLDLIALGIDEGLQLEAIRLGVGLLFKEGGALEVQGLMHAHLSSTRSELFFKQVRLTLKKLREWHDWNQDDKVKNFAKADAAPVPDSILIVRFLQLMCEGHYLPNQDIMREQPNNRSIINLLDDFVEYFNCLSKIPCRKSTEAAIRVSATILEVIQGPCEGNQKHLALNTEIIETLNRVNRAKMVPDSDEEDEIELKKTSIDIFQALLEGQGEKSVVYERVLSVVHLDIILLMSKKQTLRPEPTAAVAALLKKKPVLVESSEAQVILQTECVVLLQMLCNFKPSLYDELGISRNIEDIVGSGTAMIEIIWRGDIHRRFFHVPSVCKYLAKSSKDALVENVDRSNAENKLIDFLGRSHDLYKEVKHQRALTKRGIARVFSRENQDRATWITFILACLVNLVLLVYYGASDDSPAIPATAELAVQVLNIVQIAVAAFVLLLFIVVRIPVKQQSLAESGYSEWESWGYAAAEPMTLYYVWYLLFAFLGQFVSYNFLPFLLLDIIVKNSTTRDVLNAVIVPRRQIAMGGVVILFLVQIYSFILFLYFRDDLNEQGQYFCRTLFGCYLVGLGYGLRGGGGVGDIFNTTTGRRWVVDMTYYLVITIGMLNLIGGVIITTFGQLRENKAKRVDDTENVCFICSIDKQVFDRASEEPDGFKTHITIDHNMWNYLYFIFLLWEQDKDDDDGLEQYVRRAIDANEIMWFPLNQAIRLDQAASVEESLINDLKKSITDSEAGVLHKLDRFQGDVNLVLEQLNQTLKLDHQQLQTDASAKQNRHANMASRANLASAALNATHAVTAALSQKAAEEATVAFSRKVTLFVDLLCVSGVRFPAVFGTVFDKLYCLVSLDGAEQIVPCTHNQKANTFVFSTGTRIQLVEGLSPSDHRRVSFQLVFESSSGDKKGAVAKTVIDLAQLEVEEISLADRAILNSFFVPQGQTNKCKLSIRPSCVKL